MRLATRAAGKIAAFGAWVHAAMLDLALLVEPRLAVARPLAFRPRPWAGLLVILLLVTGLATLGAGGVAIVRELATASKQEAQP